MVPLLSLAAVAGTRFTDRGVGYFASMRRFSLSASRGQDGTRADGIVLASRLGEAVP